MHSDLPAPNRERSEVRELRLAVVLYGGASLAIYMHGTTKELQRLVKASALADRWRRRDDGERARIRRALDELAYRDPAGVRTRVVVDIIAGTSAGGINGVYLSKSIAHNRSQDSLRDLWFERGDISAAARPEGWVPMWLKVPFLFAARPRSRCSRGDEIADWMYGALREMDESRVAAGRRRDAHAGATRSSSLSPLPTSTVTAATCLSPTRHDPRGGAPACALPSRFGEGEDRFDAAHNGALAFSARIDDELSRRIPARQSRHLPERGEGGGRRSADCCGSLFRIYELSARPGRDVLR